MSLEVAGRGKVHLERMDSEVEQEGVVGLEQVVVVILDVVRHLVMCQWVNGVEESRYRKTGMEIEVVGLAEVAEAEEEGTDEMLKSRAHWDLLWASCRCRSRVSDRAFLPPSRFTNQNFTFEPASDNATTSGSLQLYLHIECERNAKRRTG